MVDQCLFEKLYDGTLNLPPPKALSGQENPTPYVFVCNDAFPLKENMMKPFPGTHVEGSLKGTYNYKLSKAHSVVENTFGIMATVFHILRKPLLLQPTKARSKTGWKSVVAGYQIQEQFAEYFSSAGCVPLCK
jgi:hypothetical protein